MEYSVRFPFWIYDYLKADEYDIKPSRKLFGKQRFAICPVENRAFKRKGHDYKSVEAATPWLNSINVYARIWKLFEDGRHKLIRELVKHINGETEEDLEGHSENTIMADLVHSKPEEVALALQKFKEGK